MLISKEEVKSATTSHTIRPASHDDIDMILRLWERADGNGTPPPQARDLVRTLIEHDGNALIVATINGEVVGTIIAAWDGWRGHLYRAVVDQKHRRTRLGPALMNAANDRFSRAKCTVSDCVIRDDKTLVARLIQRQGYLRQPDHFTRWIRRHDPSAGITFA